jgi:hypothetical protein
MTTLSPGAICTVRQFGTRLFVAKEPLPDNRYRLVCKQVDRRGRCAFQKRDAGLGDITVIHDAMVYAVGSTLRFENQDYLVLQDLGSNGVKVEVPEHTSPTRGGEPIRIPRGNVRTLDKAALVLDGLQ